MMPLSFAPSPLRSRPCPTKSCGVSRAHARLWIPKTWCREEDALGCFGWLVGAPWVVRGAWPLSGVSDPDMPRPGVLDASPLFAPGCCCKAVP